MSRTLDIREIRALKIGRLWDAFRSEPASFWLVCLYLFMEYVRPQSLYPSLDVLPWSMLTILLAYTAYFLEGNRERVKSPINVILALFFVQVLISCLFAYKSGLAFSKIRVYLDWVIIYVLIIKVVNTERRYMLFLVAFFLFNFKMSQHGFLSWAGRGFSFQNWGVTGAPGWFHNSGEFGIELCIFIPMVSYFIYALHKHWNKAMFGFFLLMPLTGIASAIASSSRGALVGLAGVALWTLFRTRYFFRVGVVLAVAAFITYNLIPEQSMERFQHAGEDKTSLQRLERWEEGIDMIKRHPMTGIGLENWMAYQRDFYKPELGYGLCHNIFIQAGSELGYPGLALLVFFFIYCFAVNARTRKIAKQIPNNFLFIMTHGLDAALIGYIISASFVTVLYYPYQWIHVAFIVALNNIAKKQLLESEESRRLNQAYSTRVHEQASQTHENLESIATRLR